MSRERPWADAGLVVGVAAIAFLAVVATVGPWLTVDPLARDLDRGLTDLGAPLGPSSDAWLGTDALGRDVWARIVGGARASLSIAAIATLIATTIGVAVGTVAGYRGGWVDVVLMRVVDLVLAFPVVLIAILLAALLRESELASSTAPVMVTLGLLTWTALARVVRHHAAVLARSPHVLAARALGASASRIVLRHVVPNLAGVAITYATVLFAQNLMLESMLSYLGLGPQPPEPSWGRMLYEARAYYRAAPHLVLAPGIAIVVAVLVFTFTSDRVRARFDPKGAT